MSTSKEIVFKNDSSYKVWPIIPYILRNKMEKIQRSFCLQIVEIKPISNNRTRLILFDGADRMLGMFGEAHHPMIRDGQIKVYTVIQVLESKIFCALKHPILFIADFIIVDRTLTGPISGSLSLGDHQGPLLIDVLSTQKGNDKKEKEEEEHDEEKYHEHSTSVPSSSSSSSTTTATSIKTMMEFEPPVKKVKFDNQAPKFIVDDPNKGVVLNDSNGLRNDDPDDDIIEVERFTSSSDIGKEKRNPTKKHFDDSEFPNYELMDLQSQKTCLDKPFCQHCGKFTHFSRTCPFTMQNIEVSNNTNGPSNTAKCPLCLKLGHKYKDCLIKRFSEFKSEGSNNLECFVCHKKGHLNCMQPFETLKPYCFCCGQAGHLGTQCELFKNPEEYVEKFNRKKY